MLIQYLIKLSISLIIVWVFYQFVLRRLTFYTVNRWYLLGCTLLAFLIPLINITPVLGSNEATDNPVARLIPTVQQYAIVFENAADCPAPVWWMNYDKWDWIALGLCTGAAFFLIRFMIRCISFFRMRNKAKLVSAGEVRLYQVDKDIIPFSFGNSIFINKQLHDESELQEIIRHEFVHVKQRHTHDIIWGELLCILNWYNPFAWLIRNSIRQNLEFIADHNVLQNGLDKKQYQYLLLKVIGNHHFSIANQFNFSSLKKRIAMMNKMKSARSHLFKFFLLLPLVVVLLFAFRSNSIKQDQEKAETVFETRSEQARRGNIVTAPVTVHTVDIPIAHPTDTVPENLINDKGYNVRIEGVKGNCTVVVRDGNKKVVEKVLLTKWEERSEFYENKYGDILPPPPPAPPTPPTPPAFSATAPSFDAKPVPFSGKPAPFDASPDAPPAPGHSADAPSAPPAPVAAPKLPKNVSGMSITNNKAVVTLKNGEKEEYDLNNETEKKAFEKKYGKMAEPPAPPPVRSSIDTRVSTLSSVSVKPTVALKSTVNLEPVFTASSVNVNANVKTNTSVNIAADVILALKINRFTTKEQLDQFIKDAKDKGVELNFNKIKYDDEGLLKQLGGKMKKDNSVSNFSLDGFQTITLLVIRKNDKTSCEIYVDKKGEEI